MGRLLTLVTLAVLATPAAYGQNGHNNGARVGKTGFIVNVNAFETCPRGDMTGSHRRAIAVQADFTGIATDRASRINKIFLRSGPDFSVKDGNACDASGAYLELPVTTANCSNCNAANLPAPTFRQYEVRARVLGKPRSKATITSCVDMRANGGTATPLCSVGERNIVVGTHDAGDGSAQNAWQNVSAQLLTVCVDKSGDGVCDDRVGLFDSSGENYWWSFDNAGRPHVQLVFFPVQPGDGSSSDPPGGSSSDPPPLGGNSGGANVNFCARRVLTISAV